MPEDTIRNPPPKPSWLLRPISAGTSSRRVLRLIESSGVRTVCRESRCPNTGECFSHGTATILILGTRCTRSCRFCGIGSGAGMPPGPDEPLRVAETVLRLGLRCVVITSVTRDDLPDGGAGRFAATVRALKTHVPDARIEVLVPDFGGSEQSVRVVLEACPDVFAHNLDTVPRLFPLIKPGADYRRSLAVIETVGRLEPGIPRKSGLMLGMGETRGEVETSLGDLASAGCSMVTIGQYLMPSRSQAPVERFVTPVEFDDWKAVALGMGFSSVASGPFVRSSYRAWE